MTPTLPLLSLTQTDHIYDHPLRFANYSKDIFTLTNSQSMYGTVVLEIKNNK